MFAAAWVITLLIMIYVTDRMGREIEHERDKVFEERCAWRSERQQLLDRIQAPSFESYKQAEIKLTKVQNGVKDPPQLEQL